MGSRVRSNPCRGAGGDSGYVVPGGIDQQARNGCCRFAPGRIGKAESRCGRESIFENVESAANTFTERTKVTLRELLTHTAGMTVHGFPGYAFDSALPTLVQVLNGEKPANTPAILVDTIPGTNWRYSGGGFVVTQLLLEDVTGQPFPKLMHDIVLGPMGMTRSTYEQPLPQSRMAEAAM